MSQFLVEAATLSVVGAAVGIALGIALAAIIAATTPLPAAVAPWSILAALTIGAGVGVVAAFIPPAGLRDWIPSLHCDRNSMRIIDRVLMALEGIGMALESLRANKVRAFLTIAGVATGVFVVVAMGATRSWHQTELPV
jgi:hypothetical protein